MSRRAIVLFVAGAVAVIGIALVGIRVRKASARADLLLANLPRVQVGMTESEVVELAGAPDEVISCQKPESNCKYKYHYSVPLQIAGDDWYIRFDSTGHVMQKRRLVSR